MVKFLFKTAIFFSTIALIALAATVIYYCQDLPNIDDLGKENNNQVVEINFSNDNRIGNYGDVYHDEARFYELPQNLINAVIATEDRKFFTHPGVDILAIVRASYVNHKAQRIVQGGSTITQQLAKLLFLKPERTLKRKIQELILAFQLEQRLTKEQILTTYLNRAYFGSGNYGITAAAKFYFGKEVAELNLNESALLAGLLKAPSKLSPHNNHRWAEERTSVVLHNMIEAGFLSRKNIKELNEDIYYQNSTSQKLYFSDFVNEQFKEYLDANDLQKKLLKVTTTLNERLQKNLENVTNKFVEENAKKLGKSQLAVIIMDRSGAILGMVGGKDYKKSQFNRATAAKRQAGSLFKTFVYLTAFENGFSPEDVFEDKKINIGTWLPDNYENKYYGKITLKKAFANSLNSVSIQLAQKLNQQEIIDIAKKLGINSEINKNDLTIALGTSESSLYELTTAYASIANDGKPVIPYAIEKISDTNGNELYRHQSSGFDSVISEKSLDEIKELMHAVIEEGTGKNANVASDIYGKTGTSQNFRDAWFIGFDDNYVIGVWIGNDDNSATNKITGGSLPAQLFARLVKL